MNHKMEIPVSETEANDLMQGRSFTWTFTTDKGVTVDVTLRPETEADMES